MKKRSPIPRVLGATLAMGILILDNRFAINAVAEGVQLCLQTVIPALFPFFVLSSILASSLNKLSGFFLRLFRLSSAGGSILLTGLLGGYPVGAKTVSEAYEDGLISRQEAERMLPLCNQCGPAFIFGLTMQLFQNVRICLLLWGIQLICVFLMTWTIPAAPVTHTRVTSPKPIPWSEAMHRGLRAMATVCGWIILFRLLIQFLQRWFLWKLPLPCQIVISGVLELTNGCMASQQIAAENLRFLICVAIISFGGLCVTMQSFSVLHPDLKHSSYFPGKVMQTAYSVLLVSALQQRICPVTIISGIVAFFCVLFFRKSKNTVAFQKKILYNGSIKDTRELLCSSEKR